MRAFVGIKFSTELKMDIHELQEKLRPYSRSGRWKHVDNFHLTLSFLGEIDEQQAGDINRVLAELAPNHQSFTLEIDKLGTFGQRNFNSFSGVLPIRVLWLGIDGGVKALRALQSDLDEKLETLGFPRDSRGYNPHVTLAQNIKINCDFDELERQIIPFVNKIEVSAIHLFVSEVSDGKRVYIPISDHRLQQGEKTT